MGVAVPVSIANCWIVHLPRSVSLAAKQFLCLSRAIACSFPISDRVDPTWGSKTGVND